MGSRMRAFRAWAGRLAAVAVVATAWASAGGDVIVLDPKGNPIPEPAPDPVFSIETDKLVYSPGDVVHVVHSVKNEGDEDYVIRLHQSPGFDLYALDGAGSRLWSAHWSEAFAQVIWSFRLLPGEAVEHSYTWDLADTAGVPVPAGQYEIAGIIYGDRDVTTAIAVVPEATSAAAMLLIAFAGICRNKRQCLATGIRARGRP